MATALFESIYQIIANAPYAVALLNEQLHYVAASRKWMDDFKLQGSIAGKAHEYLFPMMGVEWASIYQDALQGNLRKGDCELLTSLDGKQEWLKWEVQPCTDHSGKVIGLVLYMEKLTKEVTKHTTLERKLDLYEQTNEAASIGAWEFDFLQSELYWSPVTKKIHGVADEYVPDLHSAIEFFKEGHSRNTLITCFGNAFANGTPYAEDLQLVTRHGQEIWVKIYGNAEFVNGICTRVYGTFQNIQQQKLQEIQLANSEIKYRSIIENSLYGFLLTIPDTAVIDANQAAQQMFGYTLDEFKQLDRYALLDQDDPRLQEFLATRAHSGRATGELTGIRKNGEKFPCQLSASIYTDSEGKKNNSLVIIDITERKQSEEKIELAGNLIREERNLLSTLIDNLPINIYIKDLQLKKTRANRSEVNYMKGLSEEDILGKTDFELFPHDTAVNSFKEDQEVLRSGIPLISSESIDKRADGSINYLLTSKIPLRNSDAEIIGLLGISYDITKIKKAEHALAVSEEKYREIFENIQDIYYRTDENGIVTEISPSVEKYSLYKRGQIIGSPVTDFYYYQKDRDVLVDLLKHRYAVTDFEVKLKTKTNQLIYASVNARLIFKDGEVVGSEGSIRDITSRKAQEMELTELNTELKALNTHKEKLLSVIGHDLRNPIAASLKLAELALMDVDDITKDELLEYLGKMETGLQNANELLGNLLQWAKNQFNSLNFNPVLIHDLGELITRCIKRIKPMADAKNIRLVLLIPEGIKMYADKDMLDAVIRNLVSNAIKFTTEGVITVEVVITDYDLLFSVTDNGIGIPAATIPQLFNKSASYSTYGTSGEKGTGLGLELCRDFVEKHQGRIWVESKEGQGSTFYFTTPI
jgi:PAS domain S-box-containing protein